MHNSLNALLPNTAGTAAPIKLVIGYEDLPAGYRAVESCQRFIDHLKHEFEFRTTMWRFNVLRVPTLRDAAVHDLTEADLIIIAAHGSAELPSEAKSWIGALTGAKSHGARALIAFVDLGDTSTKESPVQSYLRDLARREKLDFFSHHVPAAVSGSTTSSGNSTSGRQTEFSFGEDSLYFRAGGHDWGINE